jgi:hypothetical protein
MAAKGGPDGPLMHAELDHAHPVHFRGEALPCLAWIVLQLAPSIGSAKSSSAVHNDPNRCMPQGHGSPPPFRGGRPMPHSSQKRIDAENPKTLEFPNAATELQHSRAP